MSLEHTDPKCKETRSYVGSALLLLGNYMHLRAIKIIVVVTVQVAITFACAIS